MTDWQKDNIYAQQQAQVGDFVFDAKVADVFPDMIQRSVPGYPAILNMLELLTQVHAQAGSYLYDLGCSLGAASVSMAKGLTHTDCKIIAVDNAPAMLDKARNALASHNNIEFQLNDIRAVEVKQASIVVLNFTLQFIPIADRLALLKRIHAGMQPGGILLLSEKISGATPAKDAMLVEMHHAFKRANGYSDLEVSQKRSALEKVLLPETVEAHQQRLADAGFARSDLWFQCFNFVSMLAYT